MPRSLLLSALIAATLATGCSKPEPEGPLERYGRELDEKVERARATAEQAGQRVEEIGRQLEEELEEILEEDRLR